MFQSTDLTRLLVLFTWVSATCCRVFAEQPSSDWNTIQSGLSTSLNGVIYGEGKFVIVGDGGTVATSRDGKRWELGTKLDSDLNAIDFGGGQFVAVGKAGNIYISRDALAWEKHAALSTKDLASVKYGNGMFAVVGDGGTWADQEQVILTSIDGREWARHSAPNTNSLTTIGFGEEVFVTTTIPLFFTSPLSAILSTRDFVNWSETTFQNNYQIGGIAFGSGRFVAAGSRPWMGYSTHVSVITSSDAITWTTRDTESWGAMFGITYGNGRFVAVGEQNHRFTGTWAGLILSSSDGGITWDEFVPPIGPNRLNAVTFSNGTFIAVGDSGTILQSGEFAPATGFVLDSLSASVEGFRSKLNFSPDFQPGTRFSIEASTDLSTWTTITNMTVTSESADFSDHAAARFGQRFYRLTIATVGE